jgi:hypothetical protein
MSDFSFKLRKGDLELEVSSTEATFIEAQLTTWRNALLNDKPVATPASSAGEATKS